MTSPVLLALLLVATPPADAAGKGAAAPPGSGGPASSDAPSARAAEPAAAPSAEGTRRTGDWPAKPSGKRVTLDGTMTVDQALARIAAAAEWNLVSTSGADGAKPLTLRLRRVPVEDALDAVLQGTSLVAARRGGIVSIAPSARIGLRASGARGSSGEPGAAEPPKTARQLRKEARERARELRRQQRGQDGDGDGDKVGRGDQLVKAGEPAREVVVVGGSARLEPGATAQEVVAVMGSVEIGAGANVETDVVAVGGDVHLMPGAHVGGDVVSVGGKVVADEGATIDGDQRSVDVPGLAQLLAIFGGRSLSPTTSRALSLASLLASFAVFFALAMLLMSVAPRRMESLTAALPNAPVKTAITGVLGTIAIPIAAVLLAVTVIGIPLIPVLVLAVIVAAVMGYAALALFIGRALPLRTQRARTAIQLAIGTAVILLLGQIPVLGWMVWITGWLFVIGVVVRTRFGRPTVPSAPVYGTEPPPMPPAMPPPPADPPAPPAPPVPPAPSTDR